MLHLVSIGPWLYGLGLDCCNIRVFKLPELLAVHSDRISYDGCISKSTSLSDHRIADVSGLRLHSQIMILPNHFTYEIESME